MSRTSKKTEAAKLLLDNGWSVEDVFEVLSLNQEKTVIVERIKERPPCGPLPSRPYYKEIDLEKGWKPTL